MKLNTNPVRGTVDYLPKEMEVISYAKNVILETYKKNGFLEIKTPILENLDLLTSGDSGDNQKLMFKTIKRGHDLDLTKENLSVADITEEGLRYDLTVPLVRCFANNREKLPFPFKSISFTSATSTFWVILASMPKLTFWFQGLKPMNILALTD